MAFVCSEFVSLQKKEIVEKIESLMMKMVSDDATEIDKLTRIVYGGAYNKALTDTLSLIQK